MSKTLLVLLFGLLCTSAWSQSRIVTGRVTASEDGSPLPGVNTVIKGTTTGTVTDSDGKYSIEVPSSSATLIFSFIGLSAQEIVVGDRSVIDVSLSLDITQLSEVIVTGYSSLKQSELTSSISVIGGERLQRIPIGSMDNLLQGASTGVLVTSQNGAPGANAYIRIRGIGSSTASNEPLFVIDGVQMSQNDYNAINPSDIEKVTILKDAASTSIYGARASNGVVLVTTKRGTKGNAPKISYNFQYGVKELIPYNFEMMNKEQKLKYEVELGIRTQAQADAIANGLNTPETNWEDILIRQGTVRSQDFSIAGGTKDAKYYFSVGNYKEEGISVGSEFERTSGRLNMEFNVNKWLTFGNSFTATRIYNPVLRDRFNVQNPFAAVFFYNPYEPEFQLNADGSFTLDADGNKIYNPTRQGFSISEAIRNNPDDNWTTNLIGNAFINITPIKNLVIKSQIGANSRIFRREYFIKPGSILDSFVGDPNARGNKTDTENNRVLSQWTNTAAYNFTLNGIHNFSALAGTEFIKSDDQQLSVISKGFPNGSITTQNAASAIVSGSTARFQYSIWSQFGELRYDLNHKYIVSASLRRDGSSVFGEDKRYGTFWSTSAAWNMSEENFIKNLSFFDQLKLRGSVGTSGNTPDVTQSNNLYIGLGLYGFTDYSGQVASWPRQVRNESLQWESNLNYSVGVDFGILNNRISGAVDYYVRDTKDLLFNQPISQTTGFASILRNVGEIRNSGIEFELKGDLLRGKDLDLSLFASVSTTTNEVKNLRNGGNDILNTSGVSLLREGLTANTYFLVRYVGVDPQNGNPLYLDRNDEVTSTYSANDAVAINGKSPLAKYFGNFGFNAGYKGLSLTTNFYYQGGNYIYNYQNEAFNLSDGANGRNNQRVDALNYWKQPGDVNVLPRPSLTNVINNSTRYLQRGDFIRLRNVQLGYNLPNSIISKLKLQSFQVYVQGTNLWTHNPFVSGDPEVGRGSAESGLVLAGEFTQFTFPNSRGYTFGVNVSF